MSGEKNNMADWLSRYAAEDEECDAEIEAMALGGRVIGHVSQLLGRHQVSEEDFMRECQQLEPQGVPGVKKDGKWWRHVMTGKVYVPERLTAKVVLPRRSSLPPDSTLLGRCVKSVLCPSAEELHVTLPRRLHRFVRLAARRGTTAGIGANVLKD